MVVFASKAGKFSGLRLQMDLKEFLIVSVIVGVTELTNLSCHTVIGDGSD